MKKQESAVQILKTAVNLSYYQLQVYDISAMGRENLVSTQRHVDQGFARHSTAVTFGTLVQDGPADLTVYLGEPNQFSGYTRAILVPLFVPTGKVIIESMGEINSDRHVDLKVGYYALVGCQSVVVAAADEYESGVISIDLFFNELDEPSCDSKIIVADGDLILFNELLEDADYYH